MPDTPREILQEKIVDALVASHERCIAASVNMTVDAVYVDQSRKAVARSRALLLRAAGGTRLG